MTREWFGRFAKIGSAAAMAFGIHFATQAQVFSTVSGLWADREQQVVAHMVVADETGVLLYQAFSSTDPGGSFTRLGGLFQPRTENQGTYDLGFPSPVPPGTELFITVRAFMSDSKTRDSDVVPVRDPVIDALSGVRPSGSEALTVTLVSGTEAHTLAYVLLWSAFPAGPFAPLADPIPADIVDYSVYVQYLNSPVLGAALYLKAQAIPDNSTTVETGVIQVRDQYDPKPMTRIRNWKVQ